MRNLLIAGGLAILATSTTGCAAKAALHTESQAAAIRSAEESGARMVPAAAMHLQLAKEELSAATDLSERGYQKKAQSMLLRAAADADLAVALSRQASEKLDAEAAIERVRMLKQENH